jgi:hypothetical protein
MNIKLIHFKMGIHGHASIGSVSQLQHVKTVDEYVRGSLINMRGIVMGLTFSVHEVVET